MKVSVYIAKFFAKNGVDHIFELSGGMITRIIDSIYQEKKIEIISMRHEQGCSFAADGYSRCKKNGLGVALATSGPGATNLITGIGSCFFDSVPAIFITGQVNVKELKGDLQIRQLGFQEADIEKIAEPITKKSYLIKTPESIPAIFEEAIKIAYEGRPGPVLIDIPMNIQAEEIDIEEDEIYIYKPNIKTDLVFDLNFWETFYNNLSKAKQPIILVGRGVIASQSEKIVQAWAEDLNIPIVSTLLGIGTLPSSNKLNIGMIGSYGNRWANMAFGNCDLLIVLGSRLDIRQTGADVNSFKANKLIYHIDIDKNEINHRVSDCIAIPTNVNNFVSQAIQNKPNEIDNLHFSNWLQSIIDLKNKWLDTNELKNIKGINPNVFIKSLSQKSNLAEIIATDVGSHQMWTAQSIQLNEHQKFITSGGMGAMGFSLPAAIGAYFATKKPVLSISGDGGMQINMQELQTITYHQLPIKIVVLNNQSLGMIRQFQDSYFESRYQSTVWGYSAPNFEKIAKAYDIDACTITNPDEINDAIDKLWADPTKPYLLQVMIDGNTNVFPKLAFGKPITDMEPYINFQKNDNI